MLTTIFYLNNFSSNIHLLYMSSLYLYLHISTFSTHLCLIGSIITESFHCVTNFHLISTVLLVDLCLLRSLEFLILLFDFQLLSRGSLSVIYFNRFLCCLMLGWSCSFLLLVFICICSLGFWRMLMFSIFRVLVILLAIHWF